MPELEYEEIDLGIVDGDDGADGKPAVLRKNGTNLEWAIEGSAFWQVLVSLAEITGPKGADGKKLMLQKSSTHIQMKYEGDTDWTNLVALSDLQGAVGPQGAKGETGATGAQGAAGSKILFGNTAPSTSIGAISDVYIDTGSSNWDIYTKTSTTKWDKMGALKAIDSSRLQIGDIILSTSVRSGWLECKGQLVSRTEYAELFNKLGTKYGAGDGTTTFALPNYPPDLSYTLTGDVVQFVSAPAGIVRIIKAKEVS